MEKKIITRNIAMVVDEALNYRELMDLDNPQVATQALQMAALFQQALVPIESGGMSSLRFDVNKARELAVQDPEMAITGFTDQTLVQNNNSVELMVGQVMSVLENVVGAVISASAEMSITGAIESAFTNLNVQEDDAWIFWTKEEAHATAYQYNIMFAVQNASTGFFVYGLPMGMLIEVNVVKEKALFITLEDSASYAVRIQALSVVEPLEIEIHRRAMSMLTRTA